MMLYYTDVTSLECWFQCSFVYGIILNYGMLLIS